MEASRSEGSEDAKQSGADTRGVEILEALKRAAHAHAHCIHEGCTRADCYTLQFLKLAALTYTHHILDRIAAKRLNGADVNAHQASALAMAEVASELAVVIAEMGAEFKLKCDVEMGRAAKC